MGDLDVSSINQAFAVFSGVCALLSALMFSLAWREGRRDDRRAAARQALARDGRARRAPAPPNHPHSAAAAAQRRAAERRAAPRPEPAPSKLPRGAEAALLAICEAVPDPRNHLALKDPTSEVSVTGTPLDPALRRAVRKADAADRRPAERRSSNRRPADRQPVGAGGLRRGRTRGAIDEGDPRTGEFFFAGEPHFNRF